MIKVNKKFKEGCCDNCNRDIFCTMSEFYDNGKDKPYVRIALCDDCLDALANMLKLSVAHELDFKYDQDEISDEHGKLYANEFLRKGQ